MNDPLYPLLQQGVVTPLSYYFARFIASHFERDMDNLLTLGAALVSQRNQQGDVCVDLARIAGRPLFAIPEDEGAPVPVAPPLQEWLQALRLDPAIGQPGEPAPLILEGSRLYLARLWNYEQVLQQAILQRTGPGDDIDPQRLRRGLERLFPDDPGRTGPDWQKLASALAVTRRFAVISGGPGTGKTTTVVRVLTLLLEQDPELRIRLAAPTGKAAARMVDAILRQRAQVDTDARTRERIPDHAGTLHRLLGYDGSRYRHHRENPLVLDCLVIDEASMVDLPLMARVLDALPAHARIILLGDRDQLASVEAGNVLGDITGHGRTIEWTENQIQRLATLTSTAPASLPVSKAAPAIADSIALLRTSYRFRDDGGIGSLARLVNEGEGERALELLRAGTSAQLGWLESNDAVPDPRLVEQAVEQYRRYLACSEPMEALETFEQFRVLCALHNGPFGVEAINRAIAGRLRASGLIDGGDEFHGKPVMVTGNDYEMQLYNGDIGLLWRNGDRSLRACFRASDNSLRDLPARSLPPHTPAWALTVHKSQGSEFREVVLILPDESSPLLSRELIYTGITRAREHVTVHASPPALVRGCRNRVQRSSGLVEKLGW